MYKLDIKLARINSGYVEGVGVVSYADTFYNDETGSGRYKEKIAFVVTNNDPLERTLVGWDVSCFAIGY